VSEARPEPEDERRLRNLQAVARHLSQSADEQSLRAAADPSSPRPAWAKKLAALGPIGVLLLFVAGKLKLIVPLLKFTKLGTLVTMLVAVWAYALYWGLPFAVGFVLLILVHESGHAWAMRRLGIKAGAPVFIPFVGAFISMKSLPRDAYVEAVVGIAGPLIGSAGALACLVVAWLSGSLFWYALASTGFLINLFNLIPVSPMDGGRVVGAIGRWLWLVGYVVGAVVFWKTSSPILFLILLLGLFSLPKLFRGPRPGYFDVPPRQRVAIGAAYFGLLAALATFMAVADRPLEGIRSGLQ
jgi:Zn-dependent protease